MAQSDFRRLSLDLSPEFVKRTIKNKKRLGFMSIREMVQQSLELMWTLREEAGKGGDIFIQKSGQTEPIKVIVPYGKSKGH